VHRHESGTMFGYERRLAGMNAPVVRHRLRASRRGESEEPDAARARLVALDVALVLQRMQKIRHRLRRLDAEPSRDLANARLIRVLGEEVYHVLIDPAFQLRERLRHVPPVACGAPGGSTCPKGLWAPVRVRTPVQGFDAGPNVRARAVNGQR